MSSAQAFAVLNADNVLQAVPEVDTHLARTHNAPAAKRSAHDELSGYDEEQVRLMDEVCIVLDEHDVPIGSASKKVCTFPPTRGLCPWPSSSLRGKGLLELTRRLKTQAIS